MACPAHPHFCFGPCSPDVPRVTSPVETRSLNLAKALVGCQTTGDRCTKRNGSTTMVFGGRTEAIRTQNTKRHEKHSQENGTEQMIALKHISFCLVLQVLQALASTCSLLAKKEMGLALQHSCLQYQPTSRSCSKISLNRQPALLSEMSSLHHRPGVRLNTGWQTLVSIARFPAKG